MKRRQIYLLVFVAVAIVLAVGIRTAVGQGYSDPIVVPKATSTTAAPAARTLEVRLTNRKTGRSQNYAWSVSMPLGGSVEIECHEWTNVLWFGVPLFGAPTNSFRRVISYDASEDGISEPYNYSIRWHTKMARAVSIKPEPPRFDVDSCLRWLARASQTQTSLARPPQAAALQK